MKVYKYDVTKVSGTIDVPMGFSPLHAAFQSSQFGKGLMLWCAVEEGNPIKTIQFEWVATGEWLEKGAVYAGTIENPQGMILHLFLHF